MTLATVTASIILRNGRLAQAGGERLALLKEIEARGSIATAAQSVGLSYKGAWDAVQALNNLYPKPMVVAQAGGQGGGRAEVTADGKLLLRAFEAVEAELAQALGALERRMSDPAHARPLSLIWSLSMKTSARNALRGVVEHVELGPVNAEVRLRVSDTLAMVAVVTRESVEELALAPGREAIALVKSSFVILAAEEPGLKTSARNSLAGQVARRIDGAVNSEIVLDLGGGKTLTATVTRQSADSLGLAPGRRALALIKASHVILAVE